MSGPERGPVCHRNGGHARPLDKRLDRAYTVRVTTSARAGAAALGFTRQHGWGPDGSEALYTGWTGGQMRAWVRADYAALLALSDARRAENAAARARCLRDAELVRVLQADAERRGLAAIDWADYFRNLGIS